MRAILVRLIIRIVAVTTMPFGVPLFAPNIVRRLMLRPQWYPVVVRRFYRLRRTEATFLPNLEPQLKAGFEHNFDYRLRPDNRLRPERCLQIVLRHDIDIRRARLLIIGPRNFSELLLAYLYGFSWRNITGVDLYSEFPKVRVGRVEDLPFPKGVFDVVICSGVLGYVARREDAMRSIVSVVRPGGLVVLETNLTVRGPIAEYSLTGGANIDDMIALVANRIQQVTHREDIPGPSGSAILQFAAFECRDQPC